MLFIKEQYWQVDRKYIETKNLRSITYTNQISNRKNLKLCSKQMNISMGMLSH